MKKRLRHGATICFDDCIVNEILKKKNRDTQGVMM